MPATDLPRERKVHPVARARVLRTERITPHMVRVVFGGDSLADFPMAESAPTDSYVKLIFAPSGAPYAVPYDVEQAKLDHPTEFWPVLRTYTVRRWDAALGELSIDFVVHGDEGVAGPWAAAAQPGDELYVRGPGGAYSPRADAGWHLFVGDDSALPAIARALEALPATATAVAVIEVGTAADEYPLVTAAQLEVTWVHRDEQGITGSGADVESDTDPDAAIVAVVRDLPFPEGQVHAFVHGAAGFVREIRRFLRVDKAVPREFLSISGYWKRGLAEDGWRSAKREWSAPVDAAEAQLDATRDERPPRV
ncbi:siderophore-interacting protein [Leifsonia sp. A12D58]|uniref:siderophore-interacting protein n=1 Tax=Leifsonia sp. A12D58 TaxID=3397674 RepID=UPI0039E14477